MFPDPFPFCCAGAGGRLPYMRVEPGRLRTVQPRTVVATAVYTYCQLYLVPVYCKWSISSCATNLSDELSCRPLMPGGNGLTAGIQHELLCFPFCLLIPVWQDPPPSLWVVALFEAFYNLDSVNSAVDKGTGTPRVISAAQHCS